MKFVIAALIGAVSCAAPTECKDGACAADHCCANLTGGDPSKAAGYAAAKADIEKNFDAFIAGNSAGKGGVCFNNKTAAKGTYVYDEAPAKNDAGVEDPDMRGAEIEWACRAAPAGTKTETKKTETKTETKTDAKEGAKDEKKDEKKKDGDAAAEGERGTLKEGEGCNHKEKGKGCVEKMCCAKVSAIDYSAIKDEAMKKKLEEASADQIKKATDANEGVCAADDKTEWEEPKSKAKMTYECSAVALATTAAVALSAMVNL